MNEEFKPLECNDDDVISFGENTYKIDRLKAALNKSSNNNLAYNLNQQLNGYRVLIGSKPSQTWFNEGIDCKILTLGSKRWRKGKVKFKLSFEFYVEEDETDNNQNSNNSEPESSLDELRQQINQLNNNE
ncbi:MAG: KGK domain-containing protein [Nostocaceae cyanobacterium]|nr:KGK domain-containing protein [Nostocaceae cyanobacterium]